MHRFFIVHLLALGFWIPSSPGSQPASSESLFFISIPSMRATDSAHPLNNMTRDTLLYMMTSFMNPIEGSPKIVEGSGNDQKDLALIPKKAVLEEALDTFLKADQTDSPLKVYALFKELLKTPTYLKTRDLQHPRFPVPETLTEFEKTYPFHQWEQEVIEKSKIKGARRIIYRSPRSAPKLSVAQTELPSTQEIRETEIIIEREDLSGQFDFYAYDSGGNLTQTSTFHTVKNTDVQASVPLTCLACHYDGSTGLFQRLPGSFLNLGLFTTKLRDPIGFTAGKALPADRE